MSGLTTEELQELSDQHKPDVPDSLGRVHCRAASDDCCCWHDDWPCRVRRLIDEVLRYRD